VNSLSTHFEVAQNFLDDMKSSISPSDSRILNQKLWSLNQQQIDLIDELIQRKADAESKLDLLPGFDNK